MRTQWVTAVVMVALALAMTVPAWADCKVQMVLKSSVLGASGTAEKKVDGGDTEEPGGQQVRGRRSRRTAHAVPRHGEQRHRHQLADDRGRDLHRRGRCG